MTLRSERVERLLHDAGDVVVDLVQVRVVAELLADVDGLEHLDGDLGWQRYVAEEVADVEAPGHGERDWEDLEAEQTIRAQKLRSGM